MKNEQDAKTENGSQSAVVVVRALDLIMKYGGIDGSHHKQWLLDQVVQVLSLDYPQWVKDYNDGEDGPETYEWDVGSAP